MRLLLACTLTSALLLAPVAQAWVAGLDRPHHAELALLAVDRLPPEWRERVRAHEDAFRQGALDPDGATQYPDREVHTYYHTYTPHDGGGGGLYRVRLSLHEAVAALREGDDAKAAYQLGFLSHFVTDLAQPLHTGEGAYDSVWHEDHEKRAWDERATYEVSPGRAPRGVEDVDAYMTDVATRSAEMTPRLLDALDRAQAPWSPEVREITASSASLAVEATADLLYTAFAQADPSRPQPRVPDTPPAPRDLEELGLSLTELRKHQPFALVALAAAACAALAGAGAWVARLRSRSRSKPRRRGTRSWRP